MLTAAVMNGLVIWIYNVINWFRRTYYHFNGAVSVYGRVIRSENQQGFWLFGFDYEGAEQQVNVYEPGGSSILDKLTTDGGEVELLWIPGKKRAMLMRYFSNKTLLVCDVVSIAALLLMIVCFVFIGTSSGRSEISNALSYVVIIAVLCMIVMALIRKKFRKY